MSRLPRQQEAPPPPVDEGVLPHKVFLVPRPTIDANLPVREALGRPPWRRGEV